MKEHDAQNFASRLDAMDVVDRQVVREKAGNPF